MKPAREEKHEVTVHEVFDAVERRILDLGGEYQPRGETLADFPVRHLFTPGLYCREITMPAGAILTSKIHKTEHPFVVSKGACRVFREDGRFEDIVAPHFGITRPGTRRFLVIFEETVWTTFHVTTRTDVGEIEDEILAERTNPLIEEAHS